MKNLNLVVTSALICSFLGFGQSEKTEINDSIPKKNISQEIVTKTIKVKGANGEEKIITQEQVITKESELKLNPDDQDKTNQTATYSPEEVSVKNSDSFSNEKLYSLTEDGKNYIIKFVDEKGERVSKAVLLSNDYYLIHNGDKDNCLGHFGENKILIIEMFDSETNSVVNKEYKPIK
ncbi:hypothetical protein GCM10022393_26470 [Aquimarina addita]|uniref:Uncharacterized protein n=1 Tax=Aquimarina addita TaxID=870485 RepID=A0ABP6UPF1_9FLAO